MLADLITSTRSRNMTHVALLATLALLGKEALWVPLCCPGRHKLR